MKRYKLELQKLHGKLYDADMVEYENGEWVEYEDAKKLVELNREMVEVLEMMVKIFKPKYDMQAITSVETIAIANAEHVLAKAGEGEGE